MCRQFAKAASGSAQRRVPACAGCGKGLPLAAGLCVDAGAARVRGALWIVPVGRRRSHCENADFRRPPIVCTLPCPGRYYDWKMLSGAIC